MKAVVVRNFGPIDSAKVEDMPIPTPGPNQVQVAIALAPVNFVDKLVIEGTYQFLPKPPFVPGKGPLGTVTALGSGVTSFRVGDRVLAMAEQGGYAEYVCADAEQCYKLPDELSFEGAASMSLAYDTAWFALTDRARISEGDVVLVLGATGAVGNAAIQLAKALGGKVIAAISSKAKAELAIKAGADATVDVAVPDLRDGLREQVHAITGGRGADIIIDPLGGDIFNAAIRSLAWRGRLVVVGFAAGAIPSLKANYLLLKNIEVSGLQVSDYRKRMPSAVRECFRQVFDLYVQGKLWSPPVNTYPLAEYAAALGNIVNRRITGRAVLKPDS